MNNHDGFWTNSQEHPLPGGPGCGPERPDHRSSRQAPEPAGNHIDRAGMVISCLCAVHCALLPMVAAILPLIGMGLLADEGTETALIGSSVALGSIGLGLGYGRHRSARALVVLAIGMSLLIAGHVGEAQGAGASARVAAVAGGLAIAGAHLINLRLCRSCPQCREAAPAGVGHPEGLDAPGNPDALESCPSETPLDQSVTRDRL